MWVRVAAPCLDPGSFLLPNLAPVFYKTTKNVSTKQQRWFSKNNKTPQSLRELLNKKNKEYCILNVIFNFFVLILFDPG